MKLQIGRGESAIGSATLNNTRRSLTLGSDPAAGFTLQGDALRPRHAVIERRLGLWWLLPLGGAALRVGGQAVASRLLRHQDRVELGDHWLEVELDEREQRAAEEGGRAADPLAKDPAYLRVPQGELAGDYPLTRDTFLIGKDPAADLRLGGLTAPAHLALVVRAQEGYELIALSAAGVFLNAKPVALRERLEPEARLELRDLYATFHLGAPRPA